MTEPTEREADIMLFIATFHRKYGYPPTFRDIGNYLGLKSSSSVHYVLSQMKRKKLITWTPKTLRTLRVL